MSGRTLRPADDPRLQEIVDNAAAGREDRDDRVVGGRAGCLMIGCGDHQIGRVNEEASAAAGNLGNPDRGGTRVKTLDDFAGVLVTGRDVAARGHPALVALEPVGGRWLRLDTSSDSALIRTEPGVCLDHDRGLMRITTRDGRTLVVSEVSEQRFKEVVTLVTQTANRT